MKLECPTKVLHEALNTVGRMVTGRSTLQILSNVLIEAKPDGLRLSATDLEVAMECTLAIPPTEAGSVTVPARTLSDVVGSLPSDSLTIETVNGHLRMASGSSEYLLNSLPADEFPGLPQVTPIAELQLSQGALRRAIRKTVFATSDDETRAILTGALLLSDGKSLKLVGTDTHRLAVKGIALEDTKAAKKFEVIVPSRALRELSRVLADDDDATVMVRVGEAQVMFSFGGLVLVSRLIDGQFPSYERVIPKHAENGLTLNREAFITALKRAALVARPEANRVVFHVADTTLSMSAESAELGQGHEEMTAEVEGEPTDIAFNAKYLIDGLDAIDGETVRLGLTGQLSPAVLSSPTEPDYQYVVMPMQLA